ncbi:hypothetical protein DSO57_1020379 [Entomophthora muscae]|uniref:Uncharacterized protein n=2 Tax=Entomophthora muscae TaxID=34485 RepID=A0ACC2UD37_9FUNG|nr:hypothetical protein DSO57_1034963 [Entomophthora muscae]KAJ9084814.1 hypothetical protein DSO57_1020379 [Entomophthora muscae]
MADTPAKAAWIHEEIIRRTERRRLRDAKKMNSVLSTSSATSPTQLDSAGRAFLAWLPIDIKKKPYSKSVDSSSPFPNLPPLTDPTPFNPIHLPSMEPTNKSNSLDHTSSQALTRLNLAAVHFLIA